MLLTFLKNPFIVSSKWRKQVIKGSVCSTGKFNIKCWPQPSLQRWREGQRKSGRKGRMTKEDCTDRDRVLVRNWLAYDLQMYAPCLCMHECMYECVIWICECAQACKKKRLNVEKRERKKEGQWKRSQCRYVDKFTLRLVKEIMSQSAKEPGLNSNQPRTMNKKYDNC